MSKETVRGRRAAPADSRRRGLLLLPPGTSRNEPRGADASAAASAGVMDQGTKPRLGTIRDASGRDLCTEEEALA